MLKKTLILGGSRGIGSVIKQVLVARGDFVYTASRGDFLDKNHIKVNLPNKIEIDENVRLNYIIFAHRYRGKCWDEDFDVTVKAIDILINQMENSFCDEAAIVILGSNAGHFVLNEQSASYHATRAALIGLTKYYAAILGKKGIRCNLVMPTTLIKPENAHFFTETNNIRKLIERITPLCRMGCAQDIANAVDFLCSEKSSFITGQSLFVDGGLSIMGQETIARELLQQRHLNEK
jgi:3-oxoacyl-[acyl-carrier protein] reductase